VKIKILGAHSGESKTTRCISFVIDDILAIDAGAITSSLTLDEQKKITSLLITHSHFDHIKDIPLLSLNLYRMHKRIKIYADQDVSAAIKKHLLNGYVYPELYQLPQEKPTVNFRQVIPLREYKIANHTVKAIPVWHHGTTYGYQVSDLEGKSIFYTSDTGIGISDSWQHVSCQLLFIETTLPNVQNEYARQTEHLTPKLLLAALKELRKVRGDLPRVVVVHTDPLLQIKIEKELLTVAANLNVEILTANEGMQFTI
jgi:ribonuclease BN (tRNA processing enzyme)